MYKHFSKCDRLPRWHAIWLAAIMSAAATALAADKPEAVDVTKLPPPAKQQVDFNKDIMPIFKKSCWDCHGDGVQMGDYRLDSRDATLKKAEHGEAIIPGKSEKSPLVHYVALLVKGKEMPPSGNDPLTKEQIGLIRAWIDQGAK
jgi:mono/diheme cytochrome c family protein